MILFVSSPTSPSWNRWSSSANQSDKMCWRWSYFGIAFTMEFILITKNYFYKIHKFLQKNAGGFYFFLFNFYDPIL